MKLIKAKDAFNPFFSRSETYSLNGEWDFAMDHSFDIPASFPQKIIVPFAVETERSGIEKIVKKDDVLHYHTLLNYVPGMIEAHVRVHFAAVDQICDVYFNKKKVVHHEGGYLPFYFDIEEAKEGDEIDLTITDDSETSIYPKGKQTIHPHGMFYRPTSGIWGDVYLEILPKTAYVNDFSIFPDFDNQLVRISNITTSNDEDPLVQVFYQGRLVGEGKGKNVTISLKDDFHTWSPTDPALYDVLIKTSKEEVKSYFGVKKFETKNNGNIKLFYLNNQPIFLNGLLDQGYFSPLSGMTYLSEESLEKELHFVKDAGFNFLRKHIKVESYRWYHLCDVLGIIVMQDFVSTNDPYSSFQLAVLPTLGKTKGKPNENHFRSLKESQNFFETEMPLFVNHFKNMTCVCLWCLFNEGWGQFDATRLTSKLRELDKTHKVIDSTSGWFDEGVGDIDSKHVYFRKPRLQNKGDRVLFLSEFGGYALPIHGHVFNTKIYGYRKLSSKQELLDWYKKTYYEWVLPLIEKEGLCGTVYTQLSDVEGEINGLLTYDREVAKLSAKELKAINDDVASSFTKKWSH